MQSDCGVFMLIIFLMLVNTYSLYSENAGKWWCGKYLKSSSLTCFVYSDVLIFLLNILWRQRMSHSDSFCRFVHPFCPSILSFYRSVVLYLCRSIVLSFCQSVVLSVSLNVPTSYFRLVFSLSFVVLLNRHISDTSSLTSHVSRLTTAFSHHTHRTPLIA